MQALLIPLREEEMEHYKQARKFVEFEIQFKRPGEFEEVQTARAYVDVNQIESFFENEDGGTYIETTCDAFVVTQDIDFVLSVIDD